MLDFSRSTIRNLSKRGVVVLSPSGLTGYLVNDNGTGRVWTFAEVLAHSAK